MREYTKGLVRLGFDLISGESIGYGHVYLIYFHWEEGCLLTVESGELGKVHKIILHYVWKPYIKNNWAFPVIDFGAKDPSGDFRSERHHTAGPYFLGTQVMEPSIELLEDKLNMMRRRGEFLLPWPEQPILKLCPERYLAQYAGVNRRQARLLNTTSATFARFPNRIRAVLSPQ